MNKTRVVHRSDRWPAAAGLALTSLLCHGPAFAEPAQTLLDAVDRQSGKFLGWFAVLVAVSTLAMALAEVVKAVFDLRRHFHQWRLQRWLGERHAEVLPELLYLAIGTRDHESVLCGQDLPKMMGQMQAAARVALDYPEHFPKLYGFLVSTDVGAAVHPSDKDPETWSRSARHSRAGGVTPGVADAAPPPSPADAAQAAQARARLSNLVSRKLDGFQLRTEYWWARDNQLLATVISIVVMWNAVGMASPDADWVLKLMLGLLGGLLAPFMKDLTQFVSAVKSGVKT